MDFAALVSAIRQAHEQCAAQAGRAVNVSLTLRNWLIGRYIHEYQLHGNDRATYGEGLIDRLAVELDRCRVTACDRQRLYGYLAFFRAYPQIGDTLPRTPLSKSDASIHRSLTGESDTDAGKSIVRSPTGQFIQSGMTLLERLSYTHLELLTAIDDPLKRAFYEIECIRGNWSVRQLKRQIATLYFERSGLSRDKEKLAAMVKAGAETAKPILEIRDPYVFEFLGLRAKDAVAETDLEAALVENLRDFLIELGHGFCLEAEQKSIVIGKTRGFVDLVFYHRILKCHVLVDLKVDEFRHEHIGQLNTYVTWYRKHMMSEGDSPPVGLLLCTGKDHALVEYALAAMDNRLFVSKYQLELPQKDELMRFLETKRRELGG
jgi:predicted nuclease of restriction endonuclease-like (RecB) superfamily